MRSLCAVAGRGACSSRATAAWHWFNFQLRGTAMLPSPPCQLSVPLAGSGNESVYACGAADGLCGTVMSPRPPVNFECRWAALEMRPFICGGVAVSPSRVSISTADRLCGTAKSPRPPGTIKCRNAVQRLVLTSTGLQACCLTYWFTGWFAGLLAGLLAALLACWRAG